MIEKDFFTRPINNDITVATIGINKDDWFCYKPGMNYTDIRSTMRKKGYDIAPIENKKAAFKKYYSFDENKELISKDIVESDRLYYLTHVRDAIWQMNNLKRTHFFLSNGKNENDIIGLLSLSNFNCREFYVYLFSLIVFVEKELASLVESDEQKGFEILYDNKYINDELRQQLDVISFRYKDDRLNDNDNDYKEYLYLHHLIWLVSAEDKHSILEYKNEAEFIKGTGKLKEIRNNIAHPVRSLVSNFKELEDLNIGLNKLYEFKSKLEKHISNLK